MKLRHIILATIALFAIGPVVSHADDGLRLVAITAARVTTALGYTPLNPANNLSEVTPATARTNLGLGTASLANTGTSGATAPLLNGLNTFSALQTFSIGGGVAIQVGTLSAAGSTTPDALDLGSSYSTVQGANPKLRLYSTSGSPGAYGIGVSLGSFDLMSAAGAQYAFGVGGVTIAKISGNGLILPKLSAAPTTAPGAGFVQVFAIPGTTGTCTLAMQAGTSTTVTNIALNAGAGC